MKMSFSTGEENVKLDAINEGKWTKTWRPQRATAAGTRGTAYVTAVAMGPNLTLLADQVPIPMDVQSGTTPRIFTGGVVNAASSQLDTPVAPGAMVTIYGENLASGQGTLAPSVPRPTELDGTEVKLGEKSLPLLYASSGQVNAQIPYDLPLNTNHHLVVRRGETLSTPEAITVAPTHPAIFTTNQRGTGQGAITNGVTGQIADVTYPVKSDDVITIYCTGLGRVDAEVPAGVAAPTDRLVRTVNPVTVTIGGKTAEVLFSGLAPGFAGLYQVNAKVPAGVQTGDEVPVTITSAGQPSPPATIAIR